MKVVLLASGKGGTGKTTLAAGLSAALAEKGQRVLLLDGDVGLRGLDLALGLSDRVVYSFADVAEGTVKLSAATVEHPQFEGLSLLTAPSEPPCLSDEQWQHLSKVLRGAAPDFVLIDGPAGLPPLLSRFAAMATQAIVVSTTDRVCLRGGEKCAAFLQGQGIEVQQLVLNRVRPRLIVRRRSQNLDDAMDEVGLPLLGILPEDEDFIVCANAGKSILRHKRRGASRALRQMAARLLGERVPLTWP